MPSASAGKVAQEDFERELNRRTSQSNCARTRVEDIRGKEEVTVVNVGCGREHEPFGEFQVP